MIIDFHAHVGSGYYSSLTDREIIRLMDLHEVDRAVLCPVDKYIAVQNRSGNDLLIKTIRKYKGRFQGFAVANPWFGKKSCDELRRALDSGLTGLKIHSVLQGFKLCDSLIDPLLEIASTYKVPVYAHTGTMGNALPFQLLELAKRFPRIQFVMGHMAFSDFWFDVVPVMEQGRNILAETSHASPDFIESVIRAVGADRVLFGSDIPESRYELEIKKLKFLPLNNNQKQALFSLNARPSFRPGEMMIIDFHAHLFKDWNGLKGMSPREMVRKMDSHNVSQTVVFTLNGFWGDFESANNELVELAKSYPDRLIPFCTVHPYAGEKAIKELKRCKQRLGINGVKLHPWAQGFFVTSDAMYRVAECALKLNMMLVFHDGTPPYCEPLQIAHLARRFPGLKVLLGHGGLKDFPGEVYLAARELPNLYVGTNSTVAALERICKVLDGERILFGSDIGFGQYSLEWFLAAIDALVIPTEVKEKILFHNARQVLEALGRS